MNNKNLESMLNKIDVISKETTKPKKERLSTTIDKDMLDDYKELCKALKIQLNDGIEIMLNLLSNNKDYLDEFLKECGRL